MAHAGLGRQIDDTGNAGKFVGKTQNRITVGYVHLAEAEALLGRQGVKTRLFERYVIVIVEIVDPNNRLAPRQQSLRQGRTDETGRASDENGHAIISSNIAGRPEPAQASEPNAHRSICRQASAWRTAFLGRRDIRDAAQ